MMDDKEYEYTYQEALHELRSRGIEVREPCLTHDGIRTIHVGNFPCTDELVFKEAWGEDAAKDIMQDSGRVWPPVVEMAIDRQKVAVAITLLELTVWRGADRGGCRKSERPRSRSKSCIERTPVGPLKIGDLTL